jgi:hypothetical protein
MNPTVNGPPGGTRYHGISKLKLPILITVSNQDAFDVSSCSIQHLKHTISRQTHHFQSFPQFHAVQLTESTNKANVHAVTVTIFSVTIFFLFDQKMQFVQN